MLPYRALIGWCLKVRHVRILNDTRKWTKAINVKKETFCLLCPRRPFIVLVPPTEPNGAPGALMFKSWCSEFVLHFTNRSSADSLTTRSLSCCSGAFHYVTLRSSTTAQTQSAYESLVIWLRENRQNSSWNSSCGDIVFVLYFDIWTFNSPVLFSLRAVQPFGRLKEVTGDKMFQLNSLLSISKLL